MADFHNNVDKKFLLVHINNAYNIGVVLLVTDNVLTVLKLIFLGCASTCYGLLGSSWPPKPCPITCLLSYTRFRMNLSPPPGSVLRSPARSAFFLSEPSPSGLFWGNSAHWSSISTSAECWTPRPDSTHPQPNMYCPCLTNIIL